jgi:hypothetical protein
MLRDGATTAGHLGDPSQAREAFDRSVAELLGSIGEPISAPGTTWPS